MQLVKPSPTTADGRREPLARLATATAVGTGLVPIAAVLSAAVEAGRRPG